MNISRCYQHLGQASKANGYFSKCNALKGDLKNHLNSDSILKFISSEEDTISPEKQQFLSQIDSSNYFSSLSKYNNTEENK